MATLIDSKMLSRAGRASSTNFRILQHKEKIAMGKTEKLIVKDWFPTVSIQSETMKSDVRTSKTSSFVCQSRVQFYESMVRYS